MHRPEIVGVEDIHLFRGFGYRPLFSVSSLSAKTDNFQFAWKAKDRPIAFRSPFWPQGT
jgi:hypothetical protein